MDYVLGDTPVSILSNGLLIAFIKEYACNRTMGSSVVCVCVEIDNVYMHRHTHTNTGCVLFMCYTFLSFSIPPENWARRVFFLCYAAQQS